MRDPTPSDNTLAGAYLLAIIATLLAAWSHLGHC
jgi:hypothetical protein